LTRQHTAENTGEQPIDRTAATCEYKLSKTGNSPIYRNERLRRIINASKMGVTHI